MQHFYQGIHGWFAFRDLYEKVAKEIPDGSTLVEIGSWQGRSLAYLAVELVNQNKLGCKLIAIDKWLGSPLDGLKLTESMRPSFEANMQKGGFFLRDIAARMPVMHLAHGLQVGGPLELSSLSGHRADAVEFQPVINILERDSAQASVLFEDRSVDFLMVDGAHDYESVRKDVIAWLPKMADGGLMTGDDYNKQWPGVILGVRDIIPRWRFHVPPNAESSSDPKQVWQHRISRWNVAQSVVRWQLDETAATPVLFLPYVSGEELLWKALRSLPADVRERTIILDQSKDGLAERDMFLGATVLRVPYQAMTFSRLQNWMQHEARRLKARAYFFMHSDAEVLDPSVLGDCLAKLDHPQVAACFTNYDALVAFDTKKLEQVGCWDESFEWYHADVDYYRRVRLRGFTIAEAGGSRVAHTPSSTIATDPAMKARVDAIAKHMESHYIHKWGGLNKHEKYSIPYNGKP